jgi:aspartyl-tRNA(Asn)/glutamyl-tRNA(Gln) amidotransferase subunit A
VRGLRLARLPAAERDGVDADVLDAYDRSLAVLAGLGAEIVDIALPFRLVDFVSMTQIMQSESYFLRGPTVEDRSLKLDENVRSRLLAGAGLSANDYLGALRHRDEMKLLMDAALTGVHAFLTPSTATAAMPLQEVDQKTTPTRFMRFANILEMCALALPNGFTAGGLPISLQSACRLRWNKIQPDYWRPSLEIPSARTGISVGLGMPRSMRRIGRWQPLFFVYR